MDKEKQLGEISNDNLDVAKSTNLKASSFSLGDLEHPNQMPFSGILTWFDAPSDNPPNGSRGRNVVIPKEVGIPALSSLKGMAINYVSGSMDGHNPQQKIGVITDAHVGEPVEDGSLPVYVDGYIYAYDFEDVAVNIKASQSVLGFSYETAKTIIEDGVWNGEQVAMVKQLGWFTGASVLYKMSAAYQTTSLVASADENTEKEVDIVDMEQFEQLMQAINGLREYVDVKFGEVIELQAGAENKEAEQEEKQEVKEVEKEEEQEVKEVEKEEEQAEKEEDKEAVKEVVKEEQVEEKEEVEVKASAELEALKTQLEAAKQELADIKASADLQASARKSVAYPTTLLSKYDMNEKDEATELLASIDAKKDLSVEERMALKFAVRDQQRKESK